MIIVIVLDRVTRSTRNIDLKDKRTQKIKGPTYKKQWTVVSNPLHGNQKKTETKQNKKHNPLQSNMYPMRAARMEESILGCSQRTQLPIKNEFWKMGRNFDKRQGGSFGGERGQHEQVSLPQLLPIPPTSPTLTGIKIKLIPFSHPSIFWPLADGAVIPTQSPSLSALLPVCSQKNNSSRE